MACFVQQVTGVNKMEWGGECGGKTAIGLWILKRQNKYAILWVLFEFWFLKTKCEKTFLRQRERGILEDIKQLLLILSSVYMDCFNVLEI